MNALVIGGAGLIGSHIINRFLIDGHEVIALDGFSTGHRSNLADNSAFSIVEGDLCNCTTVDECMTRVDRVFHEAAVSSIPKTVNDPVESGLVGYQGTLHLSEAARNNIVKRFVFASSAALYGEEPTLPKIETMFPVIPSPYAVDKVCVRIRLCHVHKKYGLEIICLRYFNVYGPRQDT